MQTLICKYYAWRARRSHKKYLAALYKDDDRAERKYGAQLLHFKRRELGVVAKRR